MCVCVLVALYMKTFLLNVSLCCWWLSSRLIYLCREEVRSVPDILVKLKSSKHYLKATELLMNSGEALVCSVRYEDCEEWEGWG